MQCAKTLLFAVLFCLGMTEAWAEPRVLIDEELKLPFAPKEAVLLVRAGDDLLRYQAYMVPPVLERGAAPDAPGAWLVGARVPVPGRDTIQYAVVVFGAGGEVFATPLKERPSTSLIDSFGTADDLHAYVRQRKEQLGASLARKAALEDELKRLQADVDLIAGIGRIVEVREESLSAEESLKRLDRDAANLEEALKQVGSYPQPRNLARREAELDSQAPELLAAAKRAEAQLKKSAEPEEESPEQKRALIEETRGESEQALVQKLGTLRRYRSELEAQADLRLNY